MSKGEYGRLQIKNGDTLIYSARPIPGNEAAIWRTINRLFDQGCKVIYESPTPIHVSGHAYQEELKMMINLTRPYYLAPVHGEPRHQHLYSEIGMNMGYPAHRIFTMKDGIPLVLDDTSVHFGEAVPVGRVLVDRGGTAGVSDDVLRDRYNIANDGLVIATIAIDMTKGELMGEPSIQTRGYSGADDVIGAAYDVLFDVLSSLSRDELRDTNRVKHDASDTLRKVIQKRSNLRPLVLPIIVEV